MTSRYSIGKNIKQTATLLDISAERVMRRAGLSPELAHDETLSVTPETYFRIWEAMYVEANRPGIEMDLAMAYAHGPFVPPIFAFSCADTLALGLARLADFKPLIGPMTLDVSRPKGKLQVVMNPVDPSLAVPPSLALMELLYITECARTFTGTHVVPQATSLPAPWHLDDACLNFLERSPAVTGEVSMTFAAEDADRPLITRSAALWETLEPAFQQQLEDRIGSATLANKVKKTLTDALPGGAASVEDIAKRLNVSKRSLQRRLSEEGTSFQALLNETRFEMSEHYLRASDLSIPEISYLLGFRDTSSFFRAFHGWTGSTPGDFRADRAAAPPGPLH